MPLYPGSADLPLNLVGVIGGLLAVGYTLLDARIKEGE